MSTIQSLGIGSGLNIKEIVTAIVDAERVPKEASLTRKEDITNAKISAYGEIKSRLSSFQSSLSSLRQVSNFNQKNATVDGTAFTATASSIAEPSNYAVEVNALAKAQSLATGAFSSVSEVIGTGTITVKFGTTTIENEPYSYDFAQDPAKQEKTITIDGTNNTVASLKDHINNNDYGFKASIINDGSGFRLVFSADSGASNSLQLTVSGDGDGVDNDNSGLSQLTMDDNSQFLTQNVAAQDASLSINGIAITSQTNTVSNAVNGLTLNLLDTTTSARTVNVTPETSQLKEQVSSMVTAYNDFISYTSELTAYTGTSGEGSLLLGDSTTRSIVNQLRSTMFSQVAGVKSGLQALSNIGILSTQSDGTLEFDEAKFDETIASAGDQFQTLFSTSGSTTDSDIQFVSGTSLTKEGTYDVSISQLATKGTFSSNPVLPDFSGGASLDINADNDGFSVRIDGSDSGPLTIPAGNYTSGENLASIIQNTINGASNLSSKGINVTVNYNAGTNSFDLQSGSYGSKSGITFTGVDTNSATELGIFAGSGTSGQDVQGTINGVAGTGEGQFLSVTTGDSKGVKIAVTGGSTSPEGTSRGSVTFSRGIADKLHNLIDSFLKPSGGFLTTRLSGLDDSLEKYTIERESLQYSMERLETRLYNQYNAIDVVVGQLNSLSSYLTSALASLPGAQKKEG